MMLEKEQFMHGMRNTLRWEGILVLQGGGSDSRMKEILEVIAKINDPVLRSQMMEAYNNNRIIWQIIKWP